MCYIKRWDWLGYEGSFDAELSEMEVEARGLKVEWRQLPPTARDEREGDFNDEELAEFTV